MKKYLIIGIVIILVGVVGFYSYKKDQSAVVTYTEYPVGKGSIAVTILSTGTVQPKNRLEIKAPVAGRIDEVLIQEGSKVKKGQIIAWMSSTERAAMLDAARSQGESEYKKWSEFYLPTPVLAPISGTIILKSVEPGQTFTNADAIFTMSDHLTVKANVDETDIAQIKLGGHASIVLDAYPQNAIEAKVDQLAFDATTTNNVTTYIIDVRPVSTPDFMRSGMTANVTFFVQEKKDILLIPSEAMKIVDGKSIVMKKGANSKPTEVSVSTGISDGKQVEVLEGLEAGDIVLIQNYNLGEGSKSSNNPFSPKFPRGTKRGSGGAGGPR